MRIKERTNTSSSIYTYLYVHSAFTYIISLLLSNLFIILMIINMKEEIFQTCQKVKKLTTTYLCTCVFQNNIPVGSVVIPKPDLTSIPRCECDPNSEAPCSSDTDCLNRMLMYECHPSVCQCGEKCHNQRFQRREYPDCTPFKTEGRGWGLRTNVDIKKVETPLFYSSVLLFDRNL